MPPTMASGKICHIEIPAVDIRRSAAFYEKVFGWRTRRRRDGSLAFDDSAGGVSGTWVLGRPPMGASGLLVYVILALVLTQRRTVAVPLCDRHRHHWLMRGLLIVFSLVICVRDPAPPVARIPAAHGRGARDGAAF